MTSHIKFIAEWWRSLDPEVRVAWVVTPIICACIVFVAGIEGGARIGGAG